MSETESDGGYYPVEKIIGYRYAKGTHEFQVKWAGYEGRDSWEPVKNLNCPLRIFEYFMEQNFEKKRQTQETQTLPYKEDDDQSTFVKIFQKGLPKTIPETQKTADILPIPDRIENINIEAREATVYFQQDPTKPLRTVPIDWLTTNFPSLVNQYFLDKASNAST
ncbi:hypothetical protein TRFO_08598 [Tritrichomonas foetus]|uniref:Chromo domain-containing protein n=1 Tax=Tritrichomonas foetus TaxID=1144522 RepID=A0A1J4JIT0_9EUKA|nr:hypothetical protein TRFO_08598 [Tritrichomonas foetus]|eukprot:OHS99042.1 hypothetical protein TRFO_08598 [Tritrichomonas foetus]